MYLALFVDDGLVAAKTQEILEPVFEHLYSTFKITTGDSSIYVGMQIKRDRKKESIFIHQETYAKRIIEKFGMQNVKPVSMPCDPHSVLFTANDYEIETETVPFREAVGSLMFLAIVSCPDIAYSMNLVSKYLNKHSNEHWRAVKIIFVYLKGTLDYGIEYCSGGTNLNLVGYSDADFDGDVDTRRSTPGFLFELAGGPVTWSSQRQKYFTLSSTESEYVATSSACKEAVWLCKLLRNLNSGSEKATVIFFDNQSTIRLVKNPEYHKRTKHIGIRYHFIREKSEAKEIAVEYIPSELQKADIFTKALTK